MTKLLDDLLDTSEKRAKRMIGTKTECMPEWLLVNQEGKRILIATPWTNREERDIVVATMKASLRAFNCLAYSLDFEAWASPAPMKDSEIDAGYRPSLDPKRKEIFMAIACDGETERTRIWEIIRNEDGSCKDIVLDMESKDTGGVLSNLFKD